MPAGETPPRCQGCEAQEPGPLCRVIQISKVRMNPYVSLLQQCLRDLGMSCWTANGLSLRLAQSWRAEADILHLHWPELLYASPNLTRSVRLLASVLGGLVWAKIGGCRIVYTVHNLSPHEQLFPYLDGMANRVLLTLADAVHVHDEEARSSVSRSYGRRERVYVIPHGSYIGAYPNHCTRQEARAWLGLSADTFVYLFLGHVRSYKGIEDLVAAFCVLGSNSSRLLIAGKVHDAAYGRSLSQLVDSQVGIHTWFEYVPDSEVQYFLNACDVCVLPYRDVTTSGAAVLALSFGRPIIAPALGGFAELAADGRGIVYDPAAADGLLKALRQARDMDTGGAGQRALAWAREHEWHRLAPRFASVYADVLGANWSLAPSAPSPLDRVECESRVS